MKIPYSCLLTVPLSLSLLVAVQAQQPENPFKDFDTTRGGKNQPIPPIVVKPGEEVKPVELNTPADLNAALWLSKRVPFGEGKKAGEIKINPKDGAQMVWVPAGAFLMGSTNADKRAKASEKPQRTVKLSGYWMYKTEVTVRQYKKFVTATNGKMPPEPNNKWQDNHPIVNVDWNNAKAYCEWAGVRLPSEAEWEKAARGTDGRIFPWGNTFSQNYSWSKEASGGDDTKVGTAPVDAFPGGKSPYGCLDMAGNVWEWCQDYYGEKYYEVAPAINPTGPLFSGTRVNRGGSWYGDSGYARCANRGANVSTFFNDSVSFRCAASP